MPHQVDTIVIGAGVIGLAVARALARQGNEVIVLEAADRFGSGISARNSEVIHAGLYYPTDSLKATLCVRGKELLYDYCATHQVAHRRLGKLLVATSDAQTGQLARIAQQAALNGVDDLQPLTASQARTLEPALACHAALLSPSTGIVDAHGLMLSLLGELEDAGGVLALNAPVTGGDLSDNPLHVDVGGTEPMRLSCRQLINCAGLNATRVAARLSEGLDLRPPSTRLAKGSYFALNGQAPFQRLIYPVPEQAGLGIHLTLDLAGQARFGPDVEWVTGETYDIDPERKALFAEAIRRYWPALPAERLQPAYAGLRPKLSGPNAPAADFQIQGPDSHGVAGWINLFGIESPGLTASLAIAEHVATLLND